MSLKYRFEYDETRGNCFNLMNSLEAAANKGAAQLGFGIEDLRQHNRTWMLYGLSISMDRPIRSEPLTVATWPSGSEGTLVFRDFEISQQDRVIGKASSSWLVVDLGSRKLVNDQDLRELIGSFASEPSHARPVSVTAASCGDGLSNTHVIGAELLDENKHLNNKHYVEFATSHLEELGLTIRNLQFSFKKEVLAGEEISVLTCFDTEGAYLHKMSSGEEERIIALARSEWFI